MTRRATVAKDFTFDAAHQLLHHAGKCANLHGHTYRLRVEVAGAISAADGTTGEGMVLDFAVLSNIWKQHLEPLLDHQDLNKTLGGIVGPTTAENLATWIFNEFRSRVEGATVTSVTLWETPTSSVRVGEA